MSVKLRLTAQQSLANRHYQVELSNEMTMTNLVIAKEHLNSIGKRGWHNSKHLFRRSICGCYPITKSAAMKYQDIKSTLVNALLGKCPQFEADELEAIVSHWLQGQNMPLPFLTTEMQNCIVTHMPQTQAQRSLPFALHEEHAPYQINLAIDWDAVPFPPVHAAKFTFIDLFAGIGGFRLAMQAQGGRCVFSSEWDNYAKKTYEANFGEVPYGDIRKINAGDVPDHDVLCAGFPCQPFSLAGVSARTALDKAHGFACETQGTLFFDIERIIQQKRPKIVFLENVKNLVSHDKGRTFATIKATIEQLGYRFAYQVIDASPLVPQKRIRCYMVCLRNDISPQTNFEFPTIEGKPRALKSILQTQVDTSFTISDKLWAGHQRRTQRNIERGTGFTAFCANLDKPANTLVARYGKDGKECLIPQAGKAPRMLTPRECARLQGFPETFLIPVAKAAAYRQFGNSVAVPVLKRIAEKIVVYLL